MEVLRRVLVLRRIAATDVTTDTADAEMHPLIAHLQALLTTLRTRGDILNLIQVTALLTLSHLGLLY